MKVKLTSDIIQKYAKYSIPELLKKADLKFHAWIRKRDEGLGCICCVGKHYSEIQAGHYYSSGKFPNLRFNELNVNGQAKTCNYYKHGNLIDYRVNLIKKIGLNKVEELDNLAAAYKHSGYKWDRYTIIEIILKYK